MSSFYGSVEPSELMATLASVRSRHMQSSIKRIGNSAGVVIPAAFLKQMNLTVGGAIELTPKQSRLLAQSDIIAVGLDPTKGHELQKTRPCIVLSRKAANAVTSTVFVMPLSTGDGAVATRAHPRMSQGQNDCGVEGIVVVDQARYLDAVSRRVCKLGKVTDAAFIEHLLRIHGVLIGLDEDFFFESA